MFSYPKFDKRGTQTLATLDGKNKDMLMDITVHKLKAGEELLLLEHDAEAAALLLYGAVTFDYNNTVVEVSRADMFVDLPSCLHVSRNTAVIITALKDSEILIQGTQNERNFPAKLYLPADIEKTVSCGGKWENTAKREVITVFDYFNAPYSNMVLGEIFVPQGRWYSYIPHHHPQPEVYYYRFQRPEGFGACFIGEKAYTVKDGSCGAFPGGKTHAQVTAPGYPLYCCWMIRHLDGNPWKRTRTDDERYTHLLRE
ncbi:MAG: 5-deoxy-glucuronate isomerase [Clostridia bacterium]|nr:5-deoxy-glucuronate isomerase [Clostridia bacterium]